MRCQPHPAPLSTINSQPSPTLTPFFITGLPRSRTSWLANWFTWDRSACLHDGLRLCQDPAGLPDLLRRPLCEYSGNSDSALPLHGPEVVKLFPGARWLFVIRPVREAADSFVDLMRREGYAGYGWRMNRVETRELFRLLDHDLKKLILQVPATDRQVVDFEDLNDHDTVCRITRFLTPKVVLSRSRWELLNSLRINPATSKLDVSHLARKECAHHD